MYGFKKVNVCVQIKILSVLQRAAHCAQGFLYRLKERAQIVAI